MWQSAFEWSGCGLGMLGALLLATHTQVSRYGWLAFLAANLTMIAFALSAHHAGLLVQQTGFMATSLLGLRRAGLWPGRLAPAGAGNPGAAKVNSSERH